MIYKRNLFRRTSVFAALLLGGLGLLTCRGLAAVAGEVPALSEFQSNWPRFRGWDGSGVSESDHAPSSEGATNGSMILWQSPIPAPGHSSPIVWGDRVFITGMATNREVFCYQASNGALLWRRVIEHASESPAKTVLAPGDTTGADPTMATDGRRVYALFANGDLAALNFEGAIVWSKYLGPFTNSYGFATSPAIWRNQLIIQLDLGSTKPSGSKLLCLDCANGKILWQRDRPVMESWSTPIVVNAGGKVQIITVGHPWLIAYSSSDGNELYRAQLLQGEVVPSAVFADGLIFVINPSVKLVALRPDGSGDVTKTHVAWSTEENIPDVAGPVARAGLLFTVDAGGVVTCFTTKDGTRIWQKNLQLGVSASPSIVGHRLFILGEKGELVTLQAGREFRELARNQLPDKFVASPAFANGRIFLRGMTNLYGLDLLSASRQRASQ